jgi:RHH-type proline utilization regulon transcriptional repressor/proline dehydrogenase/delta 1-pyrroline-5-carboxylate dehydrogenase
MAVIRWNQSSKGSLVSRSLVDLSPERDTGPMDESVRGDGEHAEELEALVDEAVALARRWASASEEVLGRAERRATARLAELVHDHSGVEFAMHFVDRVVRPEDPVVAARELSRLARPRGAGARIPRFLGPRDRVLLTLGAVAAPLAPRLVVPLAAHRVRQLVGHLVQDAGSRSLTRRLRTARSAGLQLNLNLLGEAVLGNEEADRRLAGTVALLSQPDVVYVSIKVSSVAAQLNPWKLADDRDRLIERLLPLCRLAAGRSPQTFVNLDVEEYRDLQLTLETFTGLLSQPELRELKAGIALQAYLPDSLPVLRRLIRFAVARRELGGAPIKVRLVKGANLSMERVDAELHGWLPAPYETKQQTDANYLRLLDVALRPGHEAVRIGVASHNLFHVAMAFLLARARGVADQLDVEMLQGMAPAQARAVQRTVGRVVLYTPVVAPEDFDVAISYLVRRLEENAAPQNFLYALFDSEERASSSASTVLDGQERQFRAAVTARNTVPVGARRTQDRTADAHRCIDAEDFRNEPDTDPAMSANRTWAAAALARDPGPVVGPVLTDPGAVDAVIDTALGAAPRWAATSAHERARLLRAAADALAEARGDLVSVMAHEAGKTVAESDPEISEAIDFATYYADRVSELDGGPGLVFTPARVVVVTPPWNFPVAIPLGGVLAALAAGSTAVLKPAPQTRRCAEIAVAAVHAGGVPGDVLQLVHTDEADAGRRLVTSSNVDAVVLTGASDTAALFRRWRPDLRLFAETSGKNAIVVTPSSDIDLAVADILHSAFGHAGQKCSAASLVIAVGSMARSERFRRQLADGIRSLRCGPATDATTLVGPLIGPPPPELKRALTTLEPGERWIVPPRELDEAAHLWSPGLRTGTRPGSFMHRTEVFGPVLALMGARDLEEAIDLQNGTGFGLTGGLHSLDEEEIAYWLERVEVGNAYLNRHITGAIVQRQSFGGWKGSVVGPGAKTGAPNYVAQLGAWSDGELTALPQAEVGAAAARLLTAADPLSAADPELAAGGRGQRRPCVERRVHPRARRDRAARRVECVPLPSAARADRPDRRRNPAPGDHPSPAGGRRRRRADRAERRSRDRAGTSSRRVRAGGGSPRDRRGTGGPRADLERRAAPSCARRGAGGCPRRSRGQRDDRPRCRAAVFGTAGAPDDAAGANHQPHPASLRPHRRQLSRGRRLGSRHRAAARPRLSTEALRVVVFPGPLRRRWLRRGDPAGATGRPDFLRGQGCGAAAAGVRRRVVVRRFPGDARPRAHLRPVRHTRGRR